MTVDLNGFSKGMTKAGYGLIASAAMTAVFIGASILLSKRNDGRFDDNDDNDDGQSDGSPAQSHDDSDDGLEGLEAAMSYDDEFIDDLDAAMSYDEVLKAQMSELAQDKSDKIRYDLYMMNDRKDFMSAISYLDGLTNDLISAPLASLTGCLPDHVIKIIGQYTDAQSIADKMSFLMDNYYCIIHAWFSAVEALDERARSEALDNGRLPKNFSSHTYR